MSEPTLGAAVILRLTERLEVCDAVSADYLKQIRRIGTFAASDNGFGVDSAGQFHNCAEFVLAVHLLKFLL
ncbi:MAG TPA: hypothetical protein PKH58_09780 [Paludibacteraceae bacterium]|nr:hypothetical protein [Paludibacteraceae bacterium]